MATKRPSLERHDFDGSVVRPIRTIYIWAASRTRHRFARLCVATSRSRSPGPSRTSMPFLIQTDSHICEPPGIIRQRRSTRFPCRSACHSTTSGRVICRRKVRARPNVFSDALMPDPQIDPPPQGGGGGATRRRGHAPQQARAPSTMLRMVPLPRAAGEEQPFALLRCLLPLRETLARPPNRTYRSATTLNKMRAN